MSESEDALLLECASLRTALSRFQDEAYTASVKLQRYTFDVSELQDRNAELEQENAAFAEELDILRSHTAEPSSAADAKITEFTLSLRKLSNKLTATEQQLFERIEKDTQRELELIKVKKAADNAYELAAHCRAQVEEGRVKEAELQTRHRALEEQYHLCNVALGEYATLVRKLEAGTTSPSVSRQSSDSTLVSPPPSNVLENLQSNKESLQRIVDDFSGDSAALQKQITDLHMALSSSELRTKGEAEQSALTRSELARALLELEKLKADDVSAARMVERYMKFTQSQSVALHSTLENLQIRHASTVNTLQQQLVTFERKLRTQRQGEQQLRDALDELGKELMKEKFGRRREVLLKMGLLESLERHKRKAVDGRESTDEPSRELLAAENAVKALAEELRLETARRMELELHVRQPEPPEVRSAGQSDADMPPSEAHPGVHIVQKPTSTHVSPSASPVPRPASPPAKPLPHPPLASESTSTIPDSTSTEEIPSPPSIPSSDENDPVIAALRATASRYDTISRSLRDCYTILHELREYASSSMTFDDAFIPKEVVTAALDRLCDYTEDVRVEVEIRAGDEVLLEKGFETLLSLRKTKSSPSAQETSDEFKDVNEQIEAFVSGSEPGIQKAFRSLSRKTEDIEHDVAIMKRCVHEPALAAENPISPVSPSTPPGEDHPSEVDEASRWAGWLSRSPSPRPGMRPTAQKQPSQTFGNIMTSRSLLRHSSSTQSLTSRRPSEVSVSDPFANLGLKVPMPSHIRGPLGSPPPAAVSPRQRSMSGMLMLGLGANQRLRTTSGVGLGPRPSLPSSGSLQSEAGQSKIPENDVQKEEDVE